MFPPKPQATLEKCAKCRGLIAERIVRALGKGYHPGCFSCAGCGRAIGAESFAVDERGEVYCVADFYRLGSTETGEHPPHWEGVSSSPTPPRGSRHPALLPSGNTPQFAAPASAPSSPAMTRTPTRLSAWDAVSTRAATAARYGPDRPPEAEGFGTEPFQRTPVGLKAAGVIF